MILSFIALTGIVCLLVGGMMLLQMIQRAFEKDGVPWGMLAIIYPPGTYYYCKRDWNSRRKPFLQITVLLVVGVIFWAVSKFVA